MSDTTSDPVDSTVARREFVQQLRSQAEQAAESAIYHARLSQKYQQLSVQLTDLAENSAALSVSELRTQARQLARTSDHEGAAVEPTRQTTPAFSGPALPPIPEQTATGPGVPNLASVAPKPTESESAISDTQTTSLDVAGDAQVSPVKTATDRSARKPAETPRRRRKMTIRERVEKYRAARRAHARRIRVKARQEDLAPRQRNPADELKRGGPSILTSVILVAAVVCALSSITWQLEQETPLNPIVCAFASERESDPLPVEPPEEEPGEQLEQEIEEPQPEPEPEPAPVPEPAVSEPMEHSAADTQMDVEPDAAVSSVPATSTDGVVADYRSEAGRKVLLEKYGGSAASEEAVEKALNWLASIQHPQGYWDFIHTGPAGTPGTINNPIGGTAYALLPFLAAGQTHKDGKYRKQVKAGLTYLTRVGVQTPAGYDLRGMINKQSTDKAPNEAYYVHGAATLALCEAYDMTKDRNLKRAAEGAVRFLINSQDPRGGGWRYNPQEAGSTSVTAIQVMALSAAKKAGIPVPQRVFDGVHHFLDSVQVDGEGRYGYEVDKKRYTGAVTAMALLSRMYLGWGRADGDLRAGIGLLDKAGPYDNLYSLYFATQVMKNWGGEQWKRWNMRLRDDLIAAQETTGAAAGSWKPRTGAIHAKQGGRLLTTALATLTLQVYYRYQPLLPPETTSDPAAAQQ